MLMQRTQDGPGVRISPTDGGYRGPLPAATVRATRALLARVLASSGLSRAGVGQILTMPASTLCDALKESDGDEVDPATAPEPTDVPPRIEPPASYRRFPTIDVSARFVASMRREYLKDGDSRTRRIGRLEDVEAWLAGLSPSKHRPKNAP